MSKNKKGNNNKNNNENINKSLSVVENKNEMKKKIEIDREKFLNDVNNLKVKAKGKHKKMSYKLKKLIDKQITEYRNLKKTRAAEMLSIFSEHNYYANGFTPEELRTTLEDLGPTYVKIGQIMSSRVDILPET